MRNLLSRLRPLLLAAAVSLAAPARAEEAHVLYQNSVINALLQAVYDGRTTMAELRGHGDFGLGTLNSLDGELIVLDGVFYQVTSDGAVHVVSDAARTPLAVVTRFRPQARITLAPADNFAALEKALDGQLATRNTVAAVRIHGTFPYIKARSVPRQQPPYKPLAEVVKGQSVFEFRDIAGTLVGFRTPEWMKGLNVPGYHFHFLADDHRQGGHVLDLRAPEATAEIDYANRFVMDLPEDDSFRASRLDGDMSEDLRKVEK